MQRAFYSHRNNTRWKTAIKLQWSAGLPVEFLVWINPLDFHDFDNQVPPSGSPDDIRNSIGALHLNTADLERIGQVAKP
jgi:hypothetical protein